LVNTLERVPLKSADAFVAFTGLDPRPDDSGQHRGKRRLSKRGPSELRRLLYLAAMAAKKTAAWKPLFEHYRTKGLSHYCMFRHSGPAHRTHCLVDVHLQNRI